MQLAYVDTLHSTNSIWRPPRVYGARELTSQRAHSRLFADSSRTNQERAREMEIAQIVAPAFLQSFARLTRDFAAKQVPQTHYSILFLPFFFSFVFFFHFLSRNIILPARYRYRARAVINAGLINYAKPLNHVGSVVLVVVVVRFYFPDSFLCSRNWLPVFSRSNFYFRSIFLSLV